MSNQAKIRQAKIDGKTIDGRYDIYVGDYAVGWIVRKADGWAAYASPDLAPCGISRKGYHIGTALRLRKHAVRRVEYYYEDNSHRINREGA